MDAVVPSMAALVPMCSRADPAAKPRAAGERGAPCAPTLNQPTTSGRCRGVRAGQLRKHLKPEPQTAYSPPLTAPATALHRSSFTRRPAKGTRWPHVAIRGLPAGGPIKSAWHKEVSPSSIAALVAMWSRAAAQPSAQARGGGGGEGLPPSAHTLNQPTTAGRGGGSERANSANHLKPEPQTAYSLPLTAPATALHRSSFTRRPGKGTRRPHVAIRGLPAGGP